ncbi:MAG: RHS repeat domain-containing protein [Bordetella sp.]|uniref:RHS repeat domain-containing protein n=1 Tax=Bordetella sp. TaxID=28081 RepID=UPI003F7B37C4
MVAIVSGNSLGLNLTSAGVLGQKGIFGTATTGTNKEGVYVNAATGNLILDDVDAQFMYAGGAKSVAANRVYNSASLSGNSWAQMYPVVSLASGTLNTANSTLTLNDDGTLASMGTATELMSFTYDANKRLTSILSTTPDNTTAKSLVQYGYDSSGRLTSVSVDLSPDDGSGSTQPTSNTKGSDSDASDEENDTYTMVVTDPGNADFSNLGAAPSQQATGSTTDGTNSDLGTSWREDTMAYLQQLAQPIQIEQPVAYQSGVLGSGDQDYYVDGNGEPHVEIRGELPRSTNTTPSTDKGIVDSFMQGVTGQYLGLMDTDQSLAMKLGNGLYDAGRDIQQFFSNYDHVSTSIHMALSTAGAVPVLGTIPDVMDLGYTMAERPFGKSSASDVGFGLAAVVGSIVAPEADPAIAAAKLERYAAKAADNEVINLTERGTLTNLRVDDPVMLQRPARTLVQDDFGRYWLESASGNRITPSGSYDFVTMPDGTVIVARSNVNPDFSTHLGLSSGDEVSYAGSIRFGNNTGPNRGTITSWTNSSGHYQPPMSLNSNANLPLDLFIGR